MTKIHSTAIISSKAELHPSCEVGPFCIVEDHVKIGARTKLLSHVVVSQRVTLGEDNIVHPFAVLGGVPQDLKFKGEETFVVIGNHNDIRESVTINQGTSGGGGVTKVGDHNLLMAYVHLGHDTHVENHTVIANGCQIAGHVLIQDWAIIGGLSGVSQFVRIGAHTYIGGCSGVDRDVAPFSYGKGPTGHFDVLGMNIVGLKRRSFSSEQLAALQEVSKIFFKDKTLEKNQALALVEEKLSHVDVVQHFVQFVKDSKVGLHR